MLHLIIFSLISLIYFHTHILTHSHLHILGNTGIGLALAANSRGYRTIIVIPETQSKEKKDTLRFCGAQLIEVPAFPFKDPRNYVHVAYRLSKLLQNHPNRPCPVVYPNQWDSHANRLSHYETTGPEILAQLNGKIDAFSCAMGTGGTLVGTSMALREANPDIFIGHTDPYGAVPYTYYTTGVEKAGSGSSMTEGIGQGRITGNMKGFKPSKSWEIDDTAAMSVLNDLCFEEGLQVGLSTGINVAGAIEVAKHLGPGHTIVTILCDSAMKYTNKMYNVPFLKSKGLPAPKWLDESQHQQGYVTSPTPASMLPFSLADLVQQAMDGKDMSV